MRLLLPFVLMLLSACQALPPMPAWQSPAGRGHADLGVIRDLRSGERLSPEELVERLADAERLLVGERHDNPDHHALQLWLLEALAARREPGALLLEMLDATQQARVDAVQAAARLPADLPAALAWQPGWDWALYGPILRHALTEGVPLRAANLSRDELLAVYRQLPALPAGAASAPAVAALMQMRSRFVMRCAMPVPFHSPHHKDTRPMV